jgi:HK97 family phage prohead protease
MTRQEAPELETRVTGLPVELRAAAGGSHRIGGLAAVFGVPSRDLGGFTEQLDSRVFNKSQGDNWPDVVARFNHEDTMLLGTTRSGTLSLRVDNRGLDYTVTLPEHRGDVLELVSRGDVANSSFAFQSYDDTWDFEDGTPLRTLLSARLIDVSPVVNPAYGSTSAGLRSLARHVDAPIADVIDLSNRHGLRKLFVRTDSGRSPVETRTQPTLAERRLQLLNMRYPGGRPPGGGKDARQALTELLGRRWPDHEIKAPKSGRQALIETLGKRWPQ